MGYQDYSQYSDKKLETAGNGTAPASQGEKPEKTKKPLLANPGRILAGAVLTAAVLGLGLYAGFELRRLSLGKRRNPYRVYEKEKVPDSDTGYGAIGI